ncbi:WD40 repeat-like protein [Dentipellis sp. KUC8613]|nr:WD40 repeat-like protein [Dentipellis sp. KUC8613]
MSRSADTAINRVKRIMPNLIASGDDDGIIKLWDPRKKDCIRTYTQHYDFISDFLWLDDKKQLVATSGDGTLSVMDVRAKKMEPFAHSENQEDELLSIVTIKGGTKAVVGTQLGVLSIFNRVKGWGDCVDRVLGHPHSVDALCALPSYYPSSNNTILTGSSDGLLRAVQVLPTKMVGIVADHGDFPIERIAVDRAGEGRWVGSVGHDEILRLTDLREVFEDEDADGLVGAPSEKGPLPGDEEVQASSVCVEEFHVSKREGHTDDRNDNVEGQESECFDNCRPKKKKRREKDPMKASKKRKGQNEVDVDPSFFSSLD